MPQKPIQVRRTETIEVTFDPNRCAHAAECLRAAPEVFNLAARPWMQPANASADALSGVIQRCPSGALQFRRLDGGPQEVPDSGLSVIPQANGPYHLRGDFEIRDAEGGVLGTGPRSALCRCGESGNKPFCDGAHRSARFRAP